MRNIILNRIEDYRQHQYYRHQVFGNLGKWPEGFDFSTMTDAELVSAYEFIVSTMKIAPKNLK